MVTDALAQLGQHFVLPWILISLPLIAAGGLLAVTIWLYGTERSESDSPPSH